VTMFSSSIRISLASGGRGRAAGSIAPRSTWSRPFRSGNGRAFLEELRDWRCSLSEHSGAALLIAGFVIRYGVSYRMLAPPLRNIHCYV
jgi:hypothetical protein